MKKNPLSNRTRKWMERNDISFELVENKISKLCIDLFGITNFKIDFLDNGSKGLWIYKANDTERTEYYLIKFNYKEICLELYSFIQNKLKLLNKYNRDDCWLLALQKSKEWSCSL